MDTIKSHVHAYFPAERHRSTGRFRNIFSSYGSVNHLHVISNGDNLEKRSQTQTGKAVHSFKASGPSLPLFPPADLTGRLDEPCLSGAKKENNEMETVLKDVEKSITYTGKIGVLKNAAKLSAFEGYSVTRKQVNSLYTCGALTYRKWNSNDSEGVLIYPGGEEMNTLVSVGISEGKSRAAISNKSMMSVGQNEWIYGVDAVPMDNSIICITRSIDTINVFSMKTGNHGKRPVKKDKITDSGAFLTSVALSPFGVKDYLAMNDAGVCELRKIDGCGAVDTIQCHHRFECVDHCWQCSWAMHPRQITITDRTGVALYDIRRQGHHSSAEIFTLPHSVLNPKERVFICKQYNKSPYYNFIGTSNNLILTDLRFPNHPVLKWNHLLLSPPTYLDIICDGIKSDQESTDEGAADPGSDLVLLGCQEHAETHCFPFSPASGQSPPGWLDLPWRISKPSDFSYLGEFCALEPREGVGERLSAPLIGVAGMPHVNNPGFTCFQMTSFGEIFQQTYNQSRKNKDKTFNAGPGSSDLKLNDVNSKVCCEWLSEAEQIGIQRDKVKNNRSVRLLGDAVTDLKELDKKHHAGCMFCRGTPGPTSTKGERCKRCKNIVEHSQLLYDGLQQFPNKALPNILKPWDVGSDDIAERRLRSLDVSNPKDAQSEILVRLWNFQDNIPLELLKRNEEEFIAAHSELANNDDSKKPAEKSATKGTDANEDEENTAIPRDTPGSPKETQEGTEELPIDIFSLEHLLSQPETYLDTANQDDAVEEDSAESEIQERVDVKDGEDGHSPMSSPLQNIAGTSEVASTGVEPETQGDKDQSDIDANYIDSLLFPASSSRTRRRSNSSSSEPDAKRNKTNEQSQGVCFENELDAIEEPYSFDGSQMIPSQDLFSQDLFSQSQNSIVASQNSSQKKKKSGKKKFLMGF